MYLRRFAALLATIAGIAIAMAAGAAEPPAESASMPATATAPSPVDHDGSRSDQAWLARSLIGSLLVLGLVLPFTWRMRVLNRRLHKEAGERFQTETLLRASEERLRKLLDLSPDSIVVTDPQGRISYFSLRHAELIGAPDNSATIGSSLFDLIHAEDRDAARTRVQMLLRGEVLPPRAYRLLKHDGGQFWGEVASAVIHDGIGGVEGLLTVIRDINERKFLEEALHRTNSSLMSQIQETNRLQAQLREQAVRDPLTGLYNRRYLDATLDREISRANRNGHSLALAILDIDHFKKVNDTYGHQCGDDVLKSLGAMLRTSVRGGDIACRWGGEEFMLVLPHMSLDTARQRTDQWRTAFSSIAFALGEDQANITLSVGIAVFPDHGRDAATLIQCADIALYTAKSEGRNRVVVFQNS
jgi:diguanylate cyclase (GGDEF)-like protein/PAS domain S-box-containing protein